MSFSDKDFPAHPYPGTRPTCSFVHENGTGWPLRADKDWHWTLTDTGADLDDWLTQRDAEPLSARIPLLAYGSNANPAKVTWLREQLGMVGPVVMLRVRCTGLAAVWATTLRVVDTQRPATLAAAPGHVEWHAVWLATAEQIRVLDVCEGRGERYRLVQLNCGTVTTEDGLELPQVLAYTGAGQARAPLFVHGTAVRCADVPQEIAVGLAGQPGQDGLTVTPIDGTPSPDAWPNRLFVYGTLRPGDTAWHRLSPHVDGPPVPTHVVGELYDTGRGYPAFCVGAGQIPGWLVTLRSPTTALLALDDYEGAEYRRTRVVDADGRLCWTYVWTASMDGLQRLDGRLTP